VPSHLVFDILTQTCLANRHVVGSGLLLTQPQLASAQADRGIAIGKCWTRSLPGGPAAPQGSFTMRFGAQGILYITRGTPLPNPINGPMVGGSVAVYTVGVSTNNPGAGLFVNPELMAVLRNWITQKGPQPVVLQC